MFVFLQNKIYLFFFWCFCFEELSVFRVFCHCENNTRKFDNWHNFHAQTHTHTHTQIAYVHICANETIHGLEYLFDPDLSHTIIHDMFCFANFILCLFHLPADSPPLVGDFTSTLFSRKVNVAKYVLFLCLFLMCFTLCNRYGVIYASAGKNFGPAGVCMLIVREDLISRELGQSNRPGILDWTEFTHSSPIHSIWNTPPVFQIWVTAQKNH